MTGAGFCGRPGLACAGGALLARGTGEGVGTELAAGTGLLARETGEGAGGELAGRTNDLAVGTGELSAGTGHVWLHGAEARLHEFHAGVAGDFEAACAAVQGGARAVSTALTRSNLRSLVGLAAWLGERGVAAWRIVVLRGVRDGVTPRLAVALPYALQALALAGQRGVAGWIDGAPHCLLGPFRGAALGGPRAYAAGCAGCPARGACPGVDAGYLERFGDGELSARALRDAGAPPRVGRDLFDA